MSDRFIFNLSSSTAKGLRSTNEDAHWVGTNKKNQCLAIVCDGIGSQDDSQIASLITVDVFKKLFLKRSFICNGEKFFKRCLEKAYKAISKQSTSNLNNKKIGTTLVMILITGNKGEVYNLGDSRLYDYSLEDNQWTQITQDHNLYNHFVNMKEKDPSIDINKLCLNYKDQLFALTKCLESNGNTHHDWDKFKIELHEGDVIFLATDGVYYFIKPEQVNEIIKRCSNNFETVAKNIIDVALANKSNDNLTAIVVECLKDNG
ncbi:MAG: serine/threonine-protein phosphatase [Mycoplasmataceae bacterium]|nr:serine/threonine-protein phosphatase [Mycoplasmataceae bacterium]